MIKQVIIKYSDNSSNNNNHNNNDNHFRATS